LRPQPFPVLWAALLLLVSSMPLLVFDAGFLLTAVATAAILFAGEMTTSSHRGEGVSGNAVALTALRRVIAGPAAAVVRATIAADVALLPIAVSVFSRVSAAGLLLNLVAIPLMTIVQICGMAGVIVHEVSPDLARGAMRVATLASAGLLGSARLVDIAPMLTWRVPPPALLTVVAFYVAWLTWIVARTCSARLPGRVALGCALAATGVIATAPSWASSRPGGLPAWPPHGSGGAAGRSAVSGQRSAAIPLLTVVFLDVGQGDATFVRLPSGRAWLVDAGGTPGSSSFDVGSRVVTMALWAMGVRRLDAMVLTHGDPDHVGGAPAVIDDLRPRQLWEGIPVPGHPALRRVHLAATNRGVDARFLHQGDAMQIGDVRVSVLNPALPDWQRRRVRNDDSVVLAMRFGTARVILPGDIGADIERTLAPEFASQPSALTIVKVAHHGSASSSSPAWIDALRPRLAIVSAGANNRFGHPAAAVLARYAAAGSAILRTDLCGAIAVTTDGFTARAYAWSGTSWQHVWDSARQSEVRCP
jgi:competence protein ComEC